MNQEYLYTKSAASNLGTIFCKNIEILEIGLIGKIHSNKMLLISPTCLDKLNDRILISCAANSKLRQPDLLAVPVVITDRERIRMFKKFLVQLIVIQTKIYTVLSSYHST